MQLPQFQAHADLEEQHWWFTARNRIVGELIRAVLPPSKERLIIDVGCGTGGMTHLLSKDYDCVGVDPAPEAIEFATKRFPHDRFILGSAPQDIIDLYRKADLVLLSEVLEHIDDDKGFVRTLVTEMKPGAHLLMIAPADMSLWSPHDVGFEHFRRYDRNGFRALWSGLLVRERLCSFCNSRLYPLAKLMRAIGRLRGKAWGPGDTDLAMPSPPVNSVLRGIFGGEAAALRRALEQGRDTGFRRGVSLIAVLERHIPSLDQKEQVSSHKFQKNEKSQTKI